MSGRAKLTRPLGAFEGRDVDGADIDMRTAILLALEELPTDLKSRIAMKRPRVSWQDYDEARRTIAEHVVVQVREIVECQRRKNAAGGGHG